MHFTTDDLEAVGADFLRVVAEYATQKESEWGTSEAAAKELRSVLFSAPEGPPPGSSVLNL